MDPLSEHLSLLKPRSIISSGFLAGGDWSVQFGDQQKQIKCYVIVLGSCWLVVDGVDRALRLEKDDCFVLPSGRPFRLATDLDLPPVDASHLFPAARGGGVVKINGADDFSLIGSRFAVSGGHAAMLLSLLPPVVHLRKASERSALRWSVERMMLELREGQAGGHLIAQHLAQMMLIQALRAHLGEDPGQSTGWFYALADRHLRLAINAMHANPGRRWTLRELGEQAGMSRSTFALRFKEIVGETPMQYLSRWRMLLACDRLEHADEPISAVAMALGYESESAFSLAFKRIMGCSPRQYERTRIRSRRSGNTSTDRVVESGSSTPGRTVETMPDAVR